MRQGGGKSRCRGRTTALIAATAIATLSLTGTAPAQGPAVDEYKLRLPDAKGGRSLGPEEPQARPSALPAEVRAGLKGSSEGPLLTEIATARELGAPQSVPSTASAQPISGAEDGPEGRGFLSAALSTLGDPLALLLIAALIVTGILAWIGARRRRAET
jgi:hypothetical protein